MLFSVDVITGIGDYGDEKGTVGSITSRCSAKEPAPARRHERAAEIEPTMKAAEVRFVKTLILRLFQL